MKIKVKLHPNSSQGKIIQTSNNSYEIWLKEKPIDGKANKALIKFLKNHFKTTLDSIKITSGHTSKIKTIEIN